MSSYEMTINQGCQCLDHSRNRAASGYWEAPLPLRECAKELPKDALKRLESTLRTLDKKPLM